MTSRVHLADIARMFDRFRADDFLCDTVLSARDGELRAHGLMLASVSDVFRQAFQGISGPGPHCICLPNHDRETLEIALTFIYKGTLHLPSVYRNPQAREQLFVTLRELGLEEQSLGGAEITFRSDEEDLDPDPARPASIPDHPDESIDPSLPDPSSDDHWINRELLLTNADGQELLLDNGQLLVIRGNGEVCLDDDVKVELNEIDQIQEFEDRTICYLRNPVPDGNIDGGLTMWDASYNQSKVEVVVVRPAAVSESKSLPPGGNEIKIGDFVRNQSTPECARIDEPNGDCAEYLVAEPTDPISAVGEAEEGNTEGEVFDERLGAVDSVTAGLLSGVRRILVAFKCQECGGTFSDRRSYAQHRASHLASAQESRSCAPVLLSQQECAAGGERAYQCKQCGKSFSLRFSLLRHEQLHTGMRQHLCHHCGKSFIQRVSLVEHVRLYHSDVDDPAPSPTDSSLGPLHKCLACSAAFSDALKLNAHVEKSHDVYPVPAEKNYVCAVCGKAFARALSLSTHVALHAQPRAFACARCEKSFTQRAHLAAHIKLHDGIRPHICSYCSKSFGQKGSLTQHERTHTGVKPFACAVCGKCFSVRAMLRQHENTHTGARPHACTVCDKAFAFKEGLVVHMRIHTGAKPFCCSVCGTSYTQSHHLKGHMLTHTGVKPFACDFCDKSYKNRVDLRYHCSRVHQVNITKRGDAAATAAAAAVDAADDAAADADDMDAVCDQEITS